MARIPAPAYMAISAVFHSLGPAFAVLLFARVPVVGVAWLRIVSAAVVLALWRRPWRAISQASVGGKRTVLALGTVCALMNYSYYLAIDRLPLGTVSAIEFLGPIALAAAGTRTARNGLALILTVGGIGLLMEVRLAGDPAAFVWAFANAALFTLYIVVAHKLARIDPTTNPIDRLAAAMLVAAVVATPIGAIAAAPALADPAVLAAGIGVGISSSVIPYVLDQLAMARVPRATYALFVALLPVTAVVMGVIVLMQVPTVVEAAGVTLVVLGVGIHRQRETSEPELQGA
jgi:inner membrane transporter RhtA